MFARRWRKDERMKSMSGAMLASASVAAMLVALPAATALANDVYGPFPVTVKG